METCNTKKRGQNYGENIPEKSLGSKVCVFREPERVPTWCKLSNCTEAA